MTSTLIYIVAALSFAILCVTIGILFFLRGNHLQKDPTESNHEDFKNDIINELQNLKTSFSNLQTATANDNQNMKSSVENLTKNYYKWETALTDKSYQGDLGEESLREMLHDVGLTEGINYSWEKSVDGFENNQKPDVYLKSSKGGHIVIDSKVSITAFAKSVQTNDEKEKNQFLNQHAKDIMDHVTSLSKKKYNQYFKGSPEFTVMYLHNINLYLHALAQKPDLEQEARRMNVVICTPTLLFALLKTVKLFNIQKDIEKNAETIFNLSKDIQLRLTTFVDHLQKMGRSLTSVVTAYNKGHSSFHSRLIPTINQLEELHNTDPNKKIESRFSRIETTPAQYEIEDNRDE
tara:strand:- start:950 stop:1996 length:1047 start_codon:yes stop_codon:yes gene_type:complete